MFDFDRRQWWALGALALLCGVAGVAVLYSQSRLRAVAAAPAVVAPPPPVKATPAVEGPLLVHVAGAVKQPGLYRLAAEARVADALQAAGGAAPDARLDDLNLAAHLRDGMRLSVPSRHGGPPDKVVVVTEDVWVHDPPKVTSDGRDAAAPETEVVGGLQAKTSHGGSSRKKQPPSQPLDLNRATLEQLRQLPGIGPKSAARIVAYRAVEGRFHRPEDLLNVKGIGPKSFERLRPYLAVNP